MGDRSAPLGSATRGGLPLRRMSGGPRRRTAGCLCSSGSYGGGFVNGGSSQPSPRGRVSLAQGVLVVSFNYRVGRFGTFAIHSSRKQNADGGLLGNYGYLDQIAALKWVQRNIAAWGRSGERHLIGESAGGRSINTLVTSPMAQGLFAKAVIMSGGDGHSATSGSLAQAEQIGVTVRDEQGHRRRRPERADQAASAQCRGCHGWSQPGGDVRPRRQTADIWVPVRGWQDRGRLRNGLEDGRLAKVRP